MPITIPFTVTLPKEITVRRVTNNDALDITNATIERLTEKAVDKATARVPPNTNVNIGDEIQIFHNTEGLIFGGHLIEIRKKKMWDLIIMGYGWELQNKWKVNVYSSISPEDIVSDIIGTDTNLTFASTDTSGITIEKYVANNFIYKIIEEMRQLLGWQVRTEPDKNFYFEPEGNTDSGVIWTTGTDISVQEWLDDPNSLVNHVKVKGDLANYNTTESFTATGGQTDFTLSFKPVGSVKVTVNGTEKDGSAQGKGDYDIESDNKKIIFSSGLSNGDAVEINYNYQVPIVVEGKDEPSIDSYGTYYKLLEVPHIKTFDDARRHSNEFLNANSQPQTSAKVIRRGLDVSRNSGERIRVNDTQRNINQELVIKKIKFVFPDGATEVECGSVENDINEWNAEVLERIKTLEQKTADENVVQTYNNFPHDLNITLTFDLTRKTRNINDSFILGHASNGVLGTSKLGDRRSVWVEL